MIDDVLATAEKFAPIRKSGLSWQTQCPAHDDRTPSLSISEAEDGKVLIYCHAGCSTKDVVASWGISMAALFPPDADRHQEMPPPSVVARYQYHDATGGVLFEIRRFVPKSFRPYLPNAQRAGLGGTEQVLFRLPEVIKAREEGADVWLVEGEKDVLALEAVGLVATTNPLGSKNWQPSFADALVGCVKVFIVADNDNAGQSWARDVAKSLRGRKVKHETLSVPPEYGNDTSDLLGAGRSVSDFVSNAADNTPHADATPTFRDSRILWGEFWESDRPEADWIIEPIVARARGHSLYAPAKAGKSLILLDLAVSASLGLSVFNQRASDPAVVLVVDYEMGHEDLYDRLSDMGYGPKDDLSRLHYHLFPLIAPLDTPAGAAELVNHAIEINADLVIIDTFGRAVADDENDADTIRAFYRLVGMPLKRVGIAWLRSDHTGKDISKGQRGSSAKNDDVDVVWELRVRDNNNLQLKATHKRMSWVPSVVDLRREDNPLRHVMTSDSWPAGTKALADTLDSLGVPLDWGKTRSRRVLSEAGKATSNGVLSAAIRYRKERPIL